MIDIVGASAELGSAAGPPSWIRRLLGLFHGRRMGRPEVSRIETARWSPHMLRDVGLPDARATRGIDQSGRTWL